jgi:hypothetical protein
VALIDRFVDGALHGLLREHIAMILADAGDGALGSQQRVSFIDSFPSQFRFTPRQL